MKKCADNKSIFTLFIDLRGFVFPLCFKDALKKKKKEKKAGTLKEQGAFGADWDDFYVTNASVTACVVTPVCVHNQIRALRCGRGFWLYGSSGLQANRCSLQYLF